jgi:hypothetical protein
MTCIGRLFSCFAQKLLEIDSQIIRVQQHFPCLPPNFYLPLLCNAMNLIGKENMITNQSLYNWQAKGCLQNCIYH